MFWKTDGTVAPAAVKGNVKIFQLFAGGEIQIEQIVVGAVQRFQNCVGLYIEKQQFIAGTVQGLQVIKIFDAFQRID